LVLLVFHVELAGAERLDKFELIWTLWLLDGRLGVSRGSRSCARFVAWPRAKGRAH